MDIFQYRVPAKSVQKRVIVEESWRDVRSKGQCGKILAGNGTEGANDSLSAPDVLRESWDEGTTV